MITLLIGLLLNTAQAKEQWFCTEASSKVIENQVHACGTAEAATEDEARAKAFDSAKEEYEKICDTSEACRGHEVAIDPRRTTCDSVKGKWKCFRLIVFDIKSKIANKALSVAGKIKRGMTKEALLRAIGYPHSFTKGTKLIVDGGPGKLEHYTQLFYHDQNVCSYSTCYVILTEGKVTDYYDIVTSLVAKDDI